MFTTTHHFVYTHYLQPPATTLARLEKEARAHFPRINVDRTRESDGNRALLEPGQIPSSVALLAYKKTAFMRDNTNMEGQLKTLIYHNLGTIRKPAHNKQE